MKAIALLGLMMLLCACSSLEYEKDGVDPRDVSADYRLCQAEQSLGGLVIPLVTALAGGALAVLTCVWEIDPTATAGCIAVGTAVGFLAGAGASVSSHRERVNHCMTTQGYRVSSK